MSMRVVFRADASRVIGSGHVMRCITLAEALRATGASVSFISREHEGHLCDVIEERGIQILRLPARTGLWRNAQASAYASWLGALWEEDATDTRKAILATGQKADWLVVDHYGIDADWERAVRSATDRILVVDDLEHRTHDCDMLLNQNGVASATSRCAGQVTDGCRLLLGPDYALLQPIYGQLHDRVAPREGAIRRILVAFGGADNSNVTGRVLGALFPITRNDVEVHVVLSRGHPYEAEIRAQSMSQPNVHVYGQRQSLAPLIENSDLAIGGGGMMTWERCSLGLPSLVITIGDNQDPIADELNRLGVVLWLGRQDAVNGDRIAASLRQLLDTGLDKAWSERCLALVDGRGTDRVIAALQQMSRSEESQSHSASMANGAATPELHIRRATYRDADLLLAWRNDPATIAASRQPSPVTSSDHAHWLAATLASADCQLYVVEAGGTPIGTVRVDSRTDGYELSWTVSPSVRGQGVGKWMVKLVAGTLPGVVYAHVKSENHASCAIATHAGLVACGERDGMLRFVRSG